LEEEMSDAGVGAVIYSAEQRAAAIDTVIAGLKKGTPLTVLCSADGMPCDDTVRIWADSDPELARAIARAREAGWDAIAVEALAIADETAQDTVKGAEGREMPNSEWITRSRLRVDTRLKLLAKWDPKRYGDKQLLGSDPDNPLPQSFTVNLVKPAGAQ
jgi:hypothetical protein